MRGVPRTLRTQSDDEDSHNYVIEDSEGVTEKELEVYEYRYKDAVLDFLLSKRVIFGLVGVMSIIAGFFTKSRTFKLIQRTKEGDTEIKFLTGRILMITGGSILCMILLEYTIEYISHALLKKSRGSGAFWYYTNELSHYIVIIPVVFVLYVCALAFYPNIYIENAFFLDLGIHVILGIILITLIALAVEKATAKHISMGFNYNHYVNRIRKCLLFNFFISLMENLSDAESDVVVETNNDDGPIFLVDSRGSEALSNTFILQKKFRCKNLEKLNFGSKRVLIKEFIHQARDMVSYSGNLPLILGKIRSFASRKANKLVKRLVRKNKVTNMGGFVRYFSNPDTFHYLLRQLELSEDEMVEHQHFTRMIERSYREQYVVYQSIEQVSSAISKVVVAVQFGTILCAAVILFITGFTQDNALLGALSAIFSTQFINKLVPDYMIKSLVFLFMIHPFDIGDRILVNLKDEEENLVAAELNVFSTLFYRWDGTYVFVPNYILAETPITNLQRSGPTMESHSLQINSNTDPIKLESLKQQLTDFCRANSDFFTDYVLVNYERIENSHKLFIKILMQYQTNKQNFETYLKRKTMFLMEVNRLFDVLGIRYDPPLQKVVVHGYDIQKSFAIT